MKKPLLYLVCAAALFTTACNKPAEGSANEETAELSDSVQVPVAIAKHYVNNYASHAGEVDSTASTILKGSAGKPETRCIWFSEERLTQLLKKLKKEKGDGIRFYLMTYNDTYTPDDKKYRPVPPADHWGYNTLLMVSTKDSLANGIIYHRDYYDDVAVKPKNSRSAGFIVDLVPENRGEICPPPSSCESEGALLLGN